MGKWNVSDVELGNFLENLERNYPPKWYIRSLVKDLQAARKELEEAKKDSVWRDVPPGIGDVNVNWFSEGLGLFSVNHTRTLPKTPKQELIDKFTEKNAMAMKCANLSREILEAFVKEYEEVMK